MILRLGRLKCTGRFADVTHQAHHILFHYLIPIREDQTMEMLSFDKEMVAVGEYVFIRSEAITCDRSLRSSKRKDIYNEYRYKV